MRGFPSFLALVPLVLIGCADERPTAPRVAAVAPASLDIMAFRDAIPLPNGFSPEGIAFGAGSTFYVGSLATGAVFRGDARTGAGDLIVPAQAGRSSCGVRYQARGNRLWVAGSTTGQAYVYDAATGATLAVYNLGAPGATLINDAVVLRNAVYFTDSWNPVLYRVPLGPGGELQQPSAVQTIALSGDYTSVAGQFNGNGLVATPNEDQLILGNSATGVLYRVDPATGQTRAIDLAGGSVAFDDGLMLIGRTLYVVQGAINQVGVVQLSADYATGVVDEPLANGALEFPSSIGAFGSALYAVNARFDVQPGPTVEYDVVRVLR